MDDLKELLIKKSHFFVDEMYWPELNEYVRGTSDSLNVPLVNSTCNIDCYAITGSTFDESENVIYDGAREVSRCMVTDYHYEWETDFGRRDHGWGDIVRTFAEARDGMLTNEFAHGASLANRLKTRGYDHVGMSSEEFEHRLKQTSRERIFFTLNYERACERVQNHIDKFSQ